jgi:hypothetical protein
MRRWIVLFLRRRPFSGSNRRWWSGVVEALLAASLLLGGVVLAVVSVTLAVLYSTPEGLYVSVWFFTLKIVLSLLLIAIGTYWIVRLIWDFGVSAERREALATRASGLDIVKELRQSREDLPTVPKDRNPPTIGQRYQFRLVPTARNLWGLISSASFSVILTALFTILTLIVIKALQDKTSRWEDQFEQSIGPDRLSHLPDVPWIAAALALPILFAAGWSVYQFFRQLLKLAGIGPTEIEVSNYPLKSGETCKISLTQKGRVRLKLLDVALVCQEEATFDQGTDIRTESRTVFEKRLFRRRGISLRRGQPFETEFELQVPENAMHTFKSQSNRIQWKIIVTGQAKNWPRLKRNFVVSVYPHEPLETQPRPKSQNRQK